MEGVILVNQAVDDSKQNQIMSCCITGAYRALSILAAWKALANSKHPLLQQAFLLSWPFFACLPLLCEE